MPNDFTIDLNYPELTVPKDQARFFLAVCRTKAWDKDKRVSGPPIPHTYLVAGYTDLRTNTQHILTSFGKNQKLNGLKPPPPLIQQQLKKLKTKVFPLDVGVYDAAFKNEHFLGAARNYQINDHHQANLNIAYKAYQISYRQYQETIAQLRHISDEQATVPERFDPSKHLLPDAMEYGPLHYYYNQAGEKDSDYHFVYSATVPTPDELKALYDTKFAAYANLPQHKNIEIEVLQDSFDKTDFMADPQLWRWHQHLKYDNPNPVTPAAILAASVVNPKKPMDILPHQTQDIILNNCKRGAKSFLESMDIRDPELGATSAHDMPESSLLYARHLMTPFLVTYPIPPLPEHAKKAPLQFKTLCRVNKKIHGMIKSLNKNDLALNAVKREILIRIEAHIKATKEFPSFNNVKMYVEKACDLYPPSFLKKLNPFIEELGHFTQQKTHIRAYHSEKILTLADVQSILDKHISLKSEKMLQRYHAWSNFYLLVSENMKSEKPALLSTIIQQLPKNEITLIAQQPLFQKIKTATLLEETYYKEVQTLKVHCATASVKIRKDAHKVLLFAHELYVRQGCPGKKIIYVLQTTNALLANLQTTGKIEPKRLHQKCRQYKALAESIHSTNHWSAQLGSAMLMLLGTVMFAAGLTTTILSAGTFSPAGAGLCVAGAGTFFAGAKFLADTMNLGAIVSDRTYQKTKLNHNMNKLSDHLEAEVCSTFRI